MQRRFFTVFSAVSLVLLAAICFLCARAHHYGNGHDYVEWTTSDNGGYHVGANQEALILFKFSGKIFGFDEIRAPSLVLIPVLAFLASLWVWKRWDEHQNRRCDPEPHCDRCGYDLRATPGRCPECGTAPTKLRVTT